MAPLLLHRYSMFYAYTMAATVNEKMFCLEQEIRCFHQASNTIIASLHSDSDSYLRFGRVVVQTV